MAGLEVWNGGARSLGDSVASVAPFISPTIVTLLETFKQDTDSQNRIQDIFGCDQKQAVHRGNQFIEGAYRASAESASREPPYRPIKIAPARHLSVHPAPDRPGRMRQLIEVASESIENRAVGGERRTQLVDISASLLTPGNLVGDQAGEGGAEQCRPRRDDCRD